MTRIVAVANQKGGVGKTTTAINLAASVASRGYRVLLVDFDPQGNASSGVGYPRDKVELSIYDALTGDVALADVIRPTEITTLFVVPATTDLVGAEIELIARRPPRAVPRRRARARSRTDYDYIVIDCPPSLGLLTLNALVAADGVVVPMQAEYFALEGLSALTATIEKVKAAYNPHLTIDGVLFTMFDSRHQRRQPGPRRGRSSSSATRCSPTSCRATSGCPRRRATASPCCSTTCAARAPRATSRSPTSSSTAP